MPKDNFNKNRNDDKLSKTKTADPIPMEPDPDTYKPTRGLPRIWKLPSKNISLE